MSQRVRSGRPQPLWVRVAAHLCVLIVSVAGVAQAAHIHGQLLPDRSTQIAVHVPGNGAVGEDACPLCVAMHSALPVSGFRAVLPDVFDAGKLLSTISRKPRRPWTFAAFSRPPPTSERL